MTNRGYDTCRCGRQKTGFTTLFCPVCDDTAKPGPATAPDAYLIAYTYEYADEGDLVGARRNPSMVWPDTVALHSYISSLLMPFRQLAFYRLKVASASLYTPTGQSYSLTYIDCMADYLERLPT